MEASKEQKSRGGTEEMFDTSKGAPLISCPTEEEWETVVDQKEIVFSFQGRDEKKERGDPIKATERVP